MARAYEEQQTGSDGNSTSVATQTDRGMYTWVQPVFMENIEMLLNLKKKKGDFKQEGE